MMMDINRPNDDRALKKAFLQCESIARQHYENFPVASMMLAPQIKQAIMVIYCFARTADDFADEGEHSNAKRLHLLSQYHQQIDAIYADKTVNDQWLNEPIFIALKTIIHDFSLSSQPFYDLVTAFEQDVVKNSYHDESDLLDYCQLSAAPVGRLMLQLNQFSGKNNQQYADKLCIALQLINFLQDLKQDICENKRLYIPLDNLHQLDIDEQTLRNDITQGANFTPAYRSLYQSQLARAEHILLSSAPLIDNLSGRFKLEIKLIYLSAICVVSKLRRVNGFDQRPRLTAQDKLKLGIRIFSNQPLPH